MEESKRSYTSQACDFCKKKHLKCDGDKPCFQCKRRAVVCSYAKKNIKRGPKPRKKRDRTRVSETSSESSFSSFSHTENSDAHMSDLYRDQYSADQSHYMAPVLMSDGVIDALYGFQYRVSAFHPNSFVLDAVVAFDLIGSLMKSFHSNVALDLKLMYTVVLAHGSRMTGQEASAIEYCKYAFGYYKEIFFSDIFVEQFNRNEASRIVSSLCLLIDLKIQEGDFRNARKCVLNAYYVLDSHAEGIHPLVVHRVYSYMAGFSKSKTDISHWVDCANNLGPESTSPINRIFLNFFHCSPGLLRGSENGLFPENLTFPPERTHVEGYDLVHYQQMITELLNTEELVNQYSAEKFNDPLIDEYVNCCHLVIHGLRSIVYAQSGNKNNAYICATKTLEYAELLKGEIVFPLIPIALCYALRVLLGMGFTSVFEEGIRYLDIYSNCYPVVRISLQNLRSSGLQLQASHDFSRV